MTLLMKVAEKLPGQATHGFKLVERKETVFFFHWHEGDEPYETQYADVLEAIPDRLRAMGYDEEVDRVMTEVTANFGAA